MERPQTVSRMLMPWSEFSVIQFISLSTHPVGRLIINNVASHGIILHTPCTPRPAESTVGADHRPFSQRRHRRTNTGVAHNTNYGSAPLITNQRY